MRIVHFSIQTNHVHLIVEAKSTEALSRGMQGLLIRLAKRVNGYLGRTGKLFPDRYHAEVLSTPTQVRHALRYVLNNTRKHAGSGRTFRPGWVDPCSTAAHFDGWSSAPEHPPDCGPPPSLNGSASPTSRNRPPYPANKPRLRRRGVHSRSPGRRPSLGALPSKDPARQ
jgi:hypothetical protein